MTIPDQEQALVEMRVDGQVRSIAMTSLAPVLGQFPPEVRLSQSVVRFEMDGEEGGGLLERTLTVPYAAGGEYVAEQR